MHEPFKIDMAAVYDDSALRLSLGVTSATLTRARRAGRLRHTRKGKRTLYLGEWVLAWLRDTEAEKAVKE